MLVARGDQQGQDVGPLLPLRLSAAGDLVIQAPAVRGRHFGFDMITDCPGVPRELMVPERTWPDRGAYRTKARELAGLFKANFKTFEQGTSASIRHAGPA